MSEHLSPEEVADNCEMCGGCGEVEIQYNDGKNGTVGCPGCISKELNAKLARELSLASDANGQLEARVVELEKALGNLIIPIEIGIGKVRIAICWSEDDPQKVLRELVIYDDGGASLPVGTDCPEHCNKPVPEVGTILARLRICNAEGARVLLGDLQEVIENARVADGQAPVETATAKCRKCGGDGWVRGSELDNPSEDTASDAMTKYSCDACSPTETSNG